jgi:hypothetical protein
MMPFRHSAADFRIASCHAGAFACFSHFRFHFRRACHERRQRYGAAMPLFDYQFSSSTLLIIDYFNAAPAERQPARYAS